MNDLEHFRRKFGRYAIQNLSFYMTIVFAVGYLLFSVQAGQRFYIQYLAFIPEKVLHGQIWRFVTALLYPPVISGSVIYAALIIFIYYNFASAVENSMGSFLFNVYLFGSFLVGEIATLLYYLVTGTPVLFMPIFTHFSVFMAFAIMHSEAMVYLMFILPVKVKYLAFVEVAIYIYNFVFGTAYQRICIVAAFVPVVLFYIYYNGGSPSKIISNYRFKREQEKRRREWREQWK